MLLPSLLSTLGRHGKLEKMYTLKYAGDSGAVCSVPDALLNQPFARFSSLQGPSRHACYASIADNSADGFGIRVTLRLIHPKRGQF